MIRIDTQIYDNDTNAQAKNAKKMIRNDTLICDCCTNPVFSPQFSGRFLQMCSVYLPDPFRNGSYQLQYISCYFIRRLHVLFIMIVSFDSIISSEDSLIINEQKSVFIVCEIELLKLLYNCYSVRLFLVANNDKTTTKKCKMKIAEICKTKIC